MNTSGSEHLASQVTIHEQLVEIVQYYSSVAFWQHNNEDEWKDDNLIPTGL